MSFLARVAERALNRPLLIMPEKLAIIAGVIGGRIGVDAPDMVPALETDPRLLEQLRAAARSAPEASRFVGSSREQDADGRDAGSLPYKRTADGVAVLTITGTLVNRGAWIGSYSGTTSYEGIKFQIERAAADPKVKSIILDIESPGGEATGAFEAAAAIAAVAAQKPVTAIVNGMACSAGYALAAGASRIVSTPTGISGSIGVVLMHADYSEMLGRAGIKPTLIHAGAHKVDGNPYEPLSKGVKTDLQAEVDKFYDLFVATVAKGRKAMDEKAIRATEARTFLGAEAKQLGLVDDVGSFEDVLSDLSTAAKSRFPTAQPRGTKMSESSNGPAFVQADIDAARAAGHASGLTAGASAERARIAAILGCEAAKGRDALAAYYAFETDDSAEKAGAALAKAPAANAAPPAPVASIADRHAETAILTRVEGSAAATGAPKQPGAVTWSSVADSLNAEAARATGRR